VGLTRFNVEILDINQALSPFSPEASGGVKKRLFSIVLTKFCSDFKLDIAFALLPHNKVNLSFLKSFNSVPKTFEIDLESNSNPLKQP